MRNYNLGVGGFDEAESVPHRQNFVATPLDGILPHPQLEHISWPLSVWYLF